MATEKIKTELQKIQRVSAITTVAGRSIFSAKFVLRVIAAANTTNWKPDFITTKRKFVVSNAWLSSDNSNFNGGLLLSGAVSAILAFLPLLKSVM